MNDELRFKAPECKKKIADFVHPDLLGSKIDWEETTPESYDSGAMLSITIDEYGLWPRFENKRSRVDNNKNK